MKLFGWREEIRKRKEIRGFNGVLLRVLWEGADRYEDVLGKLAFNDIYRFRDMCGSTLGSIMFGPIEDGELPKKEDVLAKLAFRNIYKSRDAQESMSGRHSIVSGPVREDGELPKKKDK